MNKTDRTILGLALFVALALAGLLGAWAAALVGWYFQL